MFFKCFHFPNTKRKKKEHSKGESKSLIKKKAMHRDKQTVLSDHGTCWFCEHLDHLCLMETSSVAEAT